MARPRNDGVYRRTAFYLLAERVDAMDRIVRAINARREHISSRAEVIEYLFERVDEARIIGALSRRKREPECADPQCDGNHSTEDDPQYDSGYHPPMKEQTAEPAEPEDVEVVV